MLRDCDRQGHGQPSVCPWPWAWWGSSPFTCYRENKTSQRKRGNQPEFPPRPHHHLPPLQDDPETYQAEYKWKSQSWALSAESWEMGKCQCQFSLTMAEVGGAGGGAWVGLKENSSQTILRLVWGHWMLTKSLSSFPSLPPPQLDKSIPKIN